MKNRIICFLTLALSSLISGILISKMSFVGKIGISIIHTEYILLKTWWKTALLFFIIQAFLHIILSLWQFRNSETKARFILPTLFFALGILGLYYTYYDFTETSHRLLKISFHSGFYLFWATWLLNCVSFFVMFWKIDKTENL
ncbi:hypothetical protein [Chishuiella sp.]|uniref:hypothetical protein n=1 Tax=Chishuiella sp. TaxID=1969467 RepID=UPI0028A95450|nr:hypothetical protein [Chishuiella sp.]